MPDTNVKQPIVLDFGGFVLGAGLFDTSVARRFAENLPYSLKLTQWGGELYGPIGLDLGEDSPVEEIPAGGIAYTTQGNLVCIFFGQRPAWPVDYIGQIENEQWRRLLENEAKDRLEIRSA